MKRLLSIVGAVALVAVALIVRGKLNGDGSGGGGIGRPSAKPVVACTPDLQPVCDALADDGKIAKGTATLDLDDAKDPKKLDKLDGWITWDPAPAVADLLADESGSTTRWGTSTPLGTSAVSMAFVSSRDARPEPLDARCIQSWGCIARAGASRRPPVAIGVGDGTTAESLTRLYPLTPEFAEGGQYNQLDGTAIKAIIEGPPSGQDAATLTNLVTAPGNADAVVGAQPLVVQAIEDARSRGLQLGQATPQPSATVSVVVAPVGDADVSNVAKAFGKDSDARKALNELGLGPAGKLAPEARAGQLYQVRKKVG